MAAPREIIAARVLHLRSPDSGVIGQGVRYATVGVVVGVIYLTTTTVLAEVFSVPFQLALAIGFVTALLVHFTLQRLFVWVHHSEFTLPIRRQAGRYLLVAAAQYSLTVTSTSLLPSALDAPVTLVYLATVATVAMTNFLVFRNIIFRSQDRAQPLRTETNSTTCSSHF